VLSTSIIDWLTVSYYGLGQVGLLSIFQLDTSAILSNSSTVSILAQRMVLAGLLLLDNVYAGWHFGETAPAPR
jgi:hypothetical protein